MKPLRPARSAGFSLVELMVALVVSLLLLAGVLQILLSNRSSFSFQRDMAALQENARLTTFVVENVVAHAGYRVELDRNDLFDASDNFGEDAFVAGSNNEDNDNDTLRVRFQATDGHDGCTGPDADVSEVATSTLKMADLELYVNDDNTLLCRDDSAGANPVPQPIVEHVVRFNVSYGLDTDEDGSVETYADSVAGNADEVVSLRIQLLLESEDLITPTAIDHEFTFADGSPFTRSNRHAYQLVDQVVALRNAIP
jgi:type IV pilus assembly protein PilW